jgi:hypothetical protein
MSAGCFWSFPYDPNPPESLQPRPARPLGLGRGGGGGVSRATLWHCDACPVVLGKLKNGVLDVFAPRPRFGQGTVAVACPSCGEVKVWREYTAPERSAILTAADE